MRIHVCTQRELLFPEGTNSQTSALCVWQCCWIVTLHFSPGKTILFPWCNCALFLQISSFVVCYHWPQLSALFRCPLTGAQESLGHNLCLGITESIQILLGSLGGLTPSQERSLHLLCYRNKTQMNKWQKRQQVPTWRTFSFFVFTSPSVCCQLRNACQGMHWLARFVRIQILYTMYLYI